MLRTMYNLLIVIACIFAQIPLCLPLQAACGDINVFAGNGSFGWAGDNGPATAAQIRQPQGLAFDSLGNLYIADGLNYRIRKVDTSNIITTVAGTGVAGYSGDGGPALSAQLNLPSDLAFDSLGNYYIADAWNNCVRKVDTAGNITTIAGNGIAGFSGDGGPAITAMLNEPQGIAVDALGNLIISDNFNCRVRSVNSAGIITTIVGTGVCGYSGDGGLATLAMVHNPEKLYLDSGGNLYIADTANLRVRKVNASGIISTIAGNGTLGNSGDGGPATAAQLYIPEAVAGNASGILYIADRGNQNIRKVNSLGLISTVAGIGTYGCTGYGGPASLCEMQNPEGIALDGLGNLYVAVDLCSRVLKIDFSSCPSDTFTVSPTTSPTITVTLTPTISPTFSHSPTATPTSVSTAIPSLKIHLFSANPDPFGDSGIYIPYWISTAGKVDIRVYTVSGETVRDLPSYHALGGNNEEFWDGANNAGKKVQNGMYIYRVLATNDAGEQQQGFKKCAKLGK